MVRRRRPRFTQAQRAELWRRCRPGETLQAIGRALDWATPCVRYFVAETGGVPPPPRQRSRLALTVAEREEISRGLAYGRSLRAIGRGLGRASSTVSREVRRHGGRHRYLAAAADRRAWKRSRRPKRCGTPSRSNSHLSGRRSRSRRRSKPRTSKASFTATSSPQISRYVLTAR